jgi:hypothetical protein
MPRSTSPFPQRLKRNRNPGITQLGPAVIFRCDQIDHFDRTRLSYFCTRIFVAFRDDWMTFSPAAASSQMAVLLGG